MALAMATFSLNSLTLPSSQTLMLSQSPCLKPITVTGFPPTFVSAPGRRIVAGESFKLYPFNSRKDKKLMFCFDFICQNVIFASVGDLHGDLSQTRSALEMAGVLSSNGEGLWIGGDTVCFFL